MCEMISIKNKRFSFERKKKELGWQAIVLKRDFWCRLISPHSRENGDCLIEVLGE